LICVAILLQNLFPFPVLSIDRESDEAGFACTMCIYYFTKIDI